MTYNNILKAGTWISSVSFLLLLIVSFIAILFSPVTPQVFNEKDGKYINDKTRESEITTRFDTAIGSLFSLSFVSSLITAFLYACRPFND